MAGKNWQQIMVLKVFAQVYRNSLKIKRGELKTVIPAHAWQF